MKREQYDAIDAVNWSSLKHMRESPLAYHIRRYEQQKDTAALAFGRLAHTLTFEPELFSREYVIWEGGVRRGKDWDTFKNSNTGMTIVKPEDVDAASAIAQSVRTNPLVLPYLDDGDFEVTLTWSDTDTGLKCKARADWYSRPHKALIDLKTTATIDGRRFGNLAARYGYYNQMAHYRNGMRANSMPVEKTILIAVEKESPYDVGVFVLDEEALYVGETEVQELLHKLRVCTDSQKWPGRYLEEQALQLPAWMFLEDEDDIDGFDLTSGD